MRLIEPHEHPSRLEDKLTEDQPQGQAELESTLPRIEEESSNKGSKGMNLVFKFKNHIIC